MLGKDLQMVGGAFSGSFEVVVVPLAGRVACLMNTAALSDDTIQTLVSHYIARTQGTPSTGRTPASLDLPTPKGHAKRSKPYIRENTALISLCN